MYNIICLIYDLKHFCVERLEQLTFYLLYYNAECYGYKYRGRFEAVLLDICI